jgi:hypothetical protein
MTAKNLDTRTVEVADGLIGITTGLMVARDELGDERVAKFLDNVPEKGEVLWRRFRAAQRTSGQLEYGFSTFVAELTK